MLKSPKMQFVPDKAKWDIKNPANYPADSSCAKFLDRVANDVDFDFEKSAFPKSVGDRAAFFSHICDSEDKALQMIARVGEIIKALLDRAKLIPGLIHNNNMLWRRGELLRKLLEHYGNLAQKFEDEMRVLLNQLAYMAFQVHTLMNALHIQYNPATGELTDNKGALVDKTRTDLLGVDDRMKDLLDTLGSIASGNLFGQKLMLDSTPRFSMKFEKANFPDYTDEKKTQIADELATLLEATMAKLGSTSPVSKADIASFIKFKAGSLIVTVQLSEDYTKNMTEEQRKFLQMAMFQIAFTTPAVGGGLGDLYAAEQPSLPEFEMPGLVPIPENSPDEWKDALQRDFGLDTTKFSASKALPQGKKSASGGSGAAGEGSIRSTVPASTLGQGGLEIKGDVSNDAKLYALYKALISKNPGLGDKLTFEIFKNSGAYKPDEPPAASRGSSARRGSARRRSGRRGSARRSKSGKSHKYHGNLLLDFVALAALLKELEVDLATLQPVTSDDVTAFISKAELPAEDSSDYKLIEDIIKLNGVSDVVIGVDEFTEEVPLFARLAAGENLVIYAGPTAQVNAGLSSVELVVSKIDPKAEMLERIKKMANSNEVKEFIRVRPYNDKDTRATELQLGTTDPPSVFDRSPDPAVIQGQLATVVDYNGRCLNFTKLFNRKLPAGGEVPYFDTFQRFLPKDPERIPKKNWFSTVNGGVFFEPASYNDKKRSDDGVGISVIKTDMLKVRKQVSANIQYRWFDRDGKVTNNENPNKEIIKAVTPKATTIAELQKQLQTVQVFKDIFAAWKNDLNQKRTQMEDLVKTTPKSNAKYQSYEDALLQIPPSTETAFLDEYYKNRVLSESINDEFVDTVWPVLQIFFGVMVGGELSADTGEMVGGTRSTDTKNIVTLFYGASGSGKTFSAEAILKKCFHEIMHHEDDFELNLISDYNNDLFDYYSTAANLKRVTNDSVYATENKITRQNIGEKSMRLLQYDEMAERAKFLGWKEGDRGAPPKVFWEGNPNPFIKEKVPNPNLLVSLGVYRKDGLKLSDIPKGEQINFRKTDIDGLDSTLQSKVKKSMKKSGTNVLTYPIPSLKNYKGDKAAADAAFALFKEDFEKRVVGFRSVTDTGLNPESSRSHLLYIITRKTKEGQPLDVKARGAQFILADFAGTEDLNYLMTPKAWEIWKKWATRNDKKDQIVGKCTLAGNQVTGDWACVDLPALANLTALQKEDITAREAFRAALVEGWKAIKIKTLVAKQISEEIATPEDMKAYQKQLTDEWTLKLSKPLFHPGNDKIKAGFYSVDDVQKQLGYNPLDSVNNQKRQNDGFELNPNRFRLKDEDNDSIICNMVLAMHAESKHINDSLSEITVLIKAQRDAINATPPGIADIAKLKAEKKLTKNLITEILADAVVAGSAAVTIGAMNPRRTNDWETYKTMVNITSMEEACQTDAIQEPKYKDKD